MVVEKSETYRGLQKIINEQKFDKFGKSIKQEVQLKLDEILSTHDSDGGENIFNKKPKRKAKEKKNETMEDVMGNQNTNLKAKDGVLVYEQDLTKVKKQAPKPIVEKVIEIDNLDLDENGDMKIQDSVPAPVIEEVQVEKKVFWNEDPSMRLTQQGDRFDQS